MDFAVEEFQPGLFFEEDGDDFEDLFDPRDVVFLRPGRLESALAASAVQSSSLVHRAATSKAGLLSKLTQASYISWLYSKPLLLYRFSKRRRTASSTADLKRTVS